MSLNTDSVAAFGKIIFIPRNHAIPGLPDMNLIVLESEGNYQAICIDIELDTTGNSVKEACENLKKSLMAYIGQMVCNYERNTKAAIEDIVNTAYSKGDTKDLLFNRYLQAKHQYLLEKIAKKNKAKSRSEDIINAWKRIFQFQPIQFNVTMAAGIA